MDDQGKLLDFIKKVKEILEKIVGSDWLLARKVMRDRIKKAFPGVQDALGRMEKEISNLSPQDFEKKFKDHGLTGDQLDLKYEGFLDAWKALGDGGGIRLLKNLLDWVDIILGTLCSVIPGGEAAKEFKEACEKEIDATEG